MAYSWNAAAARLGGTKNRPTDLEVDETSQLRFCFYYVWYFNVLDNGYICSLKCEYVSYYDISKRECIIVWCFKM